MGGDERLLGRWSLGGSVDVLVSCCLAAARTGGFVAASASLAYYAAKVRTAMRTRRILAEERTGARRRSDIIE